MTITAKIRKIGNSLGLIIPKEEVSRKKLKEGDVVEIEVLRRTHMKEMFGSIKFRRSAQELKDEARAGWGE
jgi:putative addiction module antidote